MALDVWGLRQALAERCDATFRLLWFGGRTVNLHSRFLSINARRRTSTYRQPDGLIPNISAVPPNSPDARGFPRDPGHARETSNDRRGVITAAFGARKYIELAVDLALSVRSVSTLPVSIVTSRERASFISEAYPGVFDRVIATAGLESVKGRARYVASKLQAIRNSPYRYTAFLDSDMVCATDPSYLLDTVEDDTFQVQGTHHTAASCGDKKHDETPIARLIEELGLESYVHCSLATFAFGSKGGTRVADLMESEQAYWAERTRPFGDILHDEILLGVMGSRTGVKFLEGAKPSFQRLDLSFRRTDDFSFIHVAPMRYREAIVVMSGVASRRMKSRVPVAPSLFWLSEILSRKAEQTGRSRYSARAVKSLATRLFDT